MMVYLGDEKRYVPMTEVPANKEPRRLAEQKQKTTSDRKKFLNGSRLLKLLKF